MDIADLQSWDRGRLAALHDQAGWHIGAVAITAPHRPSGRHDLAELDELELDVNCYTAVVRAGLRTIEDIVKADSSGDLALANNIGPKRLGAIREALAEYRARHAAPSVAADRFEEDD